MPRDRGPGAGRAARAGLPWRPRARAYAVFLKREARALVWVQKIPRVPRDIGGGHNRRRLTPTPASSTGPLHGAFLSGARPRCSTNTVKVLNSKT